MSMRITHVLALAWQVSATKIVQVQNLEHWGSKTPTVSRPMAYLGQEMNEIQPELGSLIAAETRTEHPSHVQLRPLHHPSLLDRHRDQQRRSQLQAKDQQQKQHEQQKHKQKQMPTGSVSWWNGISYFFFVKAACMLSNVVFQVSPFPLVQKIRQEKDTGDADAAPLVSIAFGCIQWSFYGIFAWIVTGKAGFLVVFYANCFGAFLGIFYVVCFTMHCNSEAARESLLMYYRIITSLIFVQVCAMISLSHENALLFSGCIASCCTVASALAPMTVVPSVLESQSSAQVPLSIVSASLVSGLLWLLCGVILWDAWIAVPNTLALCMNIFLLALVARYPHSEQTSLLPGMVKTMSNKPLSSLEETVACSGGTF